MDLEGIFRAFANDVALFAELACVLCVLTGILAAVWRTGVLLRAGGQNLARARNVVFSSFAAWIILALEFALASDIVRTAIAPDWNDIGMLAAIAAIRTGLNWFLTRDLVAMETAPGSS